MRKVIILFLCFVSVFVLAFTVKQNVKATVATDSNIVIEGASIRLSGNQGMRFTGSIGSYSGGTVTKYGICLVSGNVAISDDFVIGGTVGGKSVINAEVDELDGDDNFHVVLWNIPAGAYTMDISARAYVRLDDDSVVYGTEKQARNVWTVAAKAKSAGYSSDLIDDVTDAISSNYMVKTVTSTNQFVLSNVSEDNYTYKDETTLEAMLDDLWADFIADYNAATGESLTTSVTGSAFHTSFDTGIANDDVWTFPSDCNAVKFFSGVNMVKWGWVLEYFAANSSAHTKNQANALLSIDRTCRDYKGYRLLHLDASIYNLFNQSDYQSGYPAVLTFTSYSKYANVTFPTVTDVNGSNVVKVGSNVVIPNTLRTGYALTDYQKLGGSNYDVLDDYEVTTTPAVFTPNYSIITYSITYNLNGGDNDPLNPDEYNIETATISLANASKADYDFGGWYDNSLFSGSPITSIPKGSTGDVVLYAKWNEPIPVDLDINSYNAQNKLVLNSLTPDIIVVPGLATGRYKIVNTENAGLDDKVYIYGSTLFTTIKAAAEYAGSAGKSIYAFSGTYSDEFTISQSISLYGACYNTEMKHSDTFTENSETQTIISGAITISGCNNVTIRGFVLKNRATISGVTTIGFSNIICKTSLDGAFLFNSTASSNASFDKIYEAGTSARLVYIKVKLTNLTFQNSAVLDQAAVNSSNNVDIIRYCEATSPSTALAYGNIVIRNNYFRAFQSGFMDRLPTQGTSYTIENNYFKDMRVAIYFRSGTVSISQTHTIRYNTIYNCGNPANDWDVMNITNGTNTSTYLNYNVFVNSNFGESGSNKDYIIMIRTSGKGTFDLTNNYFWNTTSENTSDFGNTYCIKNNPASGALTLWSLAPATTTANVYDPYQVVEIAGQYYIYGINLSTSGS